MPDFYTTWYFCDQLVYIRIHVFTVPVQPATVLRMRVSAFKGNKVHLPQKPCAHCQRPMSWRKSWAKNWAEVLYCSDKCRADAKRVRGTS